jgi:hypothetical protein
MRFMAFVSLIFVLLSFQSAKAANQCLERITYDHSLDSFTYSINVDEINDRYFGRDHLAAAIHYIKIVLEKKGCSRVDINFGRGGFGRSKSKCQYLVPSVASSLSCYVETNLGYFFVTRDFLTRVHVVFSRWD